MGHYDGVLDSGRLTVDTVDTTVLYQVVLACILSQRSIGKRVFTTFRVPEILTRLTDGRLLLRLHFPSSTPVRKVPGRGTSNKGEFFSEVVHIKSVLTTTIDGFKMEIKDNLGFDTLFFPNPIEIFRSKYKLTHLKTCQEKS